MTFPGLFLPPERQRFVQKILRRLGDTWQCWSLSLLRQILRGRLDVPYNRFVKDWIRVRRCDQSQRRVWPNDIVKLVVVDVERLGSEGLLSGAGPKKHLLGVSKVLSCTREIE